MNEQEFKQALKKVHEAAEGKPPPFSDVWGGAESAQARSKRRYLVFGGVAAAVAAVTITIALWPTQPADEYFIADSLMNSTSWSAPSDSLMPEHQFDIYREIPFLNESTNSPEGTLL